MDTNAVSRIAKNAVQGMATPREIPSVFVQLHASRGDGVPVHLGSLLEELELDEPLVGVDTVESGPT